MTQHRLSNYFQFQPRRFRTSITVAIENLHTYCYYCHRTVRPTAAQVPVFYDLLPGLVIDGKIYTSVRTLAHEECVDARRLEEVDP